MHDVIDYSQSFCCGEKVFRKKCHDLEKWLAINMEMPFMCFQHLFSDSGETFAKIQK